MSKAKDAQDILLLLSSIPLGSLSMPLLRRLSSEIFFGQTHETVFMLLAAACALEARNLGLVNHEFAGALVHAMGWYGENLEAEVERGN